MSLKWAVLLATAAVFCTGLGATDRLAADAVSANYRTGVPEEKSLNVPADIRSAVSANPEAGLPLLVQYLVSDTNDEFIKVKRIHDWITDNIAYDSDLLLGLSDQGSRKVIDLVKFKRTTCGGYSHLFHHMASLAGIPVETITGNSKTCWIKSSARDCHHVWNAVNLRGKWYYVDTTADGRFTYKHGAFTPKKRYHDVYLFMTQQAKLLINLPLEERQQFLNPPVSRATYLGTPRVSVLYHKYDIQYTAQTIAQFREAKRDFEGGALQKVFDMADSPNELFELRFRAPANVMFFPQLVKEAGESFDDNTDSDKADDKVDLNARTFCLRESAEQVLCQYSAAKPGKYKAYLSAKEAGDLYKFGLIHAFTLVAQKAGPILPLSTSQLFTGPLFVQQGLNIVAADLNPTTPFPWVDVTHPEANFITSFVFGMDGKQVPASVDYSFLSRERIRFYYKFAKPGTYWVRLQTRIPNETGAPRQNVAVARLDVTQPTAAKFPPDNDFIFTKALVENGMALVSTDIATSTGDVNVTISGTSGKTTECQLYDASGKAMKALCAAAPEADTTRFTFATAASGTFGGRLFLKEGTQKKIIGYFRLVRP